MAHRKAALALGGIASIGLAVSCGSLLGYESLTFRDEDAGPRADGASEVDGGSGRAGACSALHGPAMVRIDTYCIDATEVTVADYGAFLQALPDGGIFPGQPSVCAYKTTHLPEVWPRTLDRQNFPIREVDWCDAWSFCAWAGKRLCGRVGGGALPVSSLGDPAADEWFRACSHAGTTKFAYGSTYDKSRCISEATSPGDAGGSPGCEGGYPGLFDMSGNEREWVDACERTDGSMDRCASRSTEYDHATVSDYACAYYVLSPRDARLDAVGVRCCED